MIFIINNIFPTLFILKKFNTHNIFSVNIVIYFGINKILKCSILSIENNKIL